MDIHTLSVTRTAAETKKIGQDFGNQVKNRMPGSGQSSVICLYGDLGSGKTTFTQGLASAFGISGRLLSPTFTIIRRYGIEHSGFLYHLDLYRLGTRHEILDIGIEDMMKEKNSVVVIEWAERMETLLPAQRYDIRFSVKSDGAHSIEIDKVTL